jgi:hypothetical protein
MLAGVTMNDGTRFVVVKKTGAGVVIEPMGKVRLSKATMREFLAGVREAERVACWEEQAKTNPYNLRDEVEGLMQIEAELDRVLERSRGATRRS